MDYNRLRRAKKIKTVMSIAGSDSSGGAGIQADIKTFAALGVYATSVITAITAQNTQGIYGILEVPPDLVASQIDVILKDIGADSAKTGMLANPDIVEVVSNKIQEYHIPSVVVDPVMSSKRGETLLQKTAVESLREKLIPLSSVITPNIPEAEILLGYELFAPKDKEDKVSQTDILLALKQAARKIYAMGAKNVLLKGGHLPFPEEAIDLLYDGKIFREFRSPRIQTHNTHGTGCTFASAIAAWLAKGASVERAVEEAKNYITLAIQNSFSVGKGCSPVHHFFQQKIKTDN